LESVNIDFLLFNVDLICFIHRCGIDYFAGDRVFLSTVFPVLGLDDVIIRHEQFCLRAWYSRKLERIE
jgi:hypothetical protein